VYENLSQTDAVRPVFLHAQYFHSFTFRAVCLCKQCKHCSWRDRRTEKTCSSAYTCALMVSSLKSTLLHWFFATT